jgi:hypothetical protein
VAVGPDGRRRKKYKQETLPTREAAEARVREIENARATTAAVVGRREREEPFATYAAAWVGEARDAVALGELKTRSIADREGTLRRYVLPVFAARPIGAITRTEPRAFLSSLITRGLAPATVKGAVDALRRVLDLAVDAGVLPSNPAVLRRKAGAPRTRHLITRLADDQAQTILKPAPEQGPRGDATAVSTTVEPPIHSDGRQPNGRPVNGATFTVPDTVPTNGSHPAPTSDPAVVPTTSAHIGAGLGQYPHATGAGDAAGVDGADPGGPR